METHYHSQFDNDEFYDEQVYRLHHELFALLIEALDRTAVVPLCFERVMKRAARSLDEELGELWVSPEVAVKLEEMKQLFEQAAEFSWREYEEVREINNRYSSLLSQGREAQAEELFQRERKREAELLRRFKLEQDEFVRIDWYGNVYYLHELCMEKIRLLGGAVKNLREGKISAALRKLYQVDNNAYAFMFSEEVYRHFTEYVLDQPKNRLKWGYQRLAGHENLYPLVTGLLQRESGGERDCRKEADALDEALSRQLRALLDALDTLEKITKKDFIQR